MDAAVIAFVGVSDLDRAEEFYAERVGLALIDERPHALVALHGDTMLRITAVGSIAPAPHTVAGWQVDDIEATVDELAGRGVVFTAYDGMGQDRRGIWSAPGGARVAWFNDPDGNVLSVSQLPG
jgi:catechol 2,3-dioxygenase-like lactoylglutathione lyase family enzyme